MRQVGVREERGMIRDEGAPRRALTLGEDYPKKTLPRVLRTRIRGVTAVKQSTKLK